MSREKTIFMPMGHFLREQRESAGLNQTEVAEVLNVKPQFVSNWERGKSCVPLRMARKVCTLYGLPRETFVAKSIEFYKAFVKTELGLRGTA